MFAYNLSGMEFTSILDILRLLDSGTAAENISVIVPHQFLDSYKCHIGMSYIVVLSSTANLSNIFDDGGHLNYNLLKINHLANIATQPDRCSTTFAQN